jgi:hypothetical protein
MILIMFWLSREAKRRKMPKKGSDAEGIRGSKAEMWVMGRGGWSLNRNRSG